MKKKIRIGMAQINPTVGDMRNNVKKIIKYTEKGKRLGVDILSFPELALTGYPPEDLLFNKRFIAKNREYLDIIAGAVDGITIIVGFVDGEKDIYNAAAVICNRSIAGVYRKILLPNYGVFDEKRYFQPGGEYCAFHIEGIVFAVNICEDIWSPDGPAAIQADKGYAPLLFNISSSPYYAGKVMMREKMLKERASGNRAYIAYNNMVGGQDELVFDGGGMILSPEGNVIVRGKQFEEDMIVADIDLTQQALAKKNKDHRIKDIYLTGGFMKGRKNVLKKKDCPPYNMTEEIYDALRTGTRDYVIKNGFQKVVIGLSGGIDSALTAVIAVDALSNKKVIGVSMPSAYSSRSSIEDAEELASQLEIKLLTLPIRPIVERYVDTLSGAFKGTKQDITEENIQARIRGNLLMALSNKFGWLVLTTGNKSETGVGYCTLYGDMAGGFAVIKDVPKTLVYTLALYRNSLTEADIIPETIIKKAPSAELKPDQKDEDSLPPYSELDPILQAYIEENKPLAEIELMGYNKRLINEITGMVDRNEYKRRQAPPGIKITPKAFGKDRRFPITNKYKE